MRIHHDDAFRADSEQGAGDVSSPEVRAVQYHGLLIFAAVPAHRNRKVGFCGEDVGEWYLQVALEGE